MKVSELIQSLQALQTRYGDLPVEDAYGHPVDVDETAEVIVVE